MIERSTRGRTGLVMATLAVLALLVGAGLGLLLGWFVMPVEYVGTKMADLAPEHKDQYIVLLALAYGTDGDLEKAQARLAALDLPNPKQSLSSLIDRSISEGRSEAEIRALASLAQAMGITAPSMVPYLDTATPPPTDGLFSPTGTPVPPTETPVPTASPAAQWNWDPWLLGPVNEAGQACDAGSQYIGGCMQPVDKGCL
ncbi:MAG: hypothetical protein ACP5JJ_07400 [Anaerolineae bacterium]